MLDTPLASLNDHVFEALSFLAACDSEEGDQDAVVVFAISGDAEFDYLSEDISRFGVVLLALSDAC